MSIDSTSAESNLIKLGLCLPEPPTPLGAYVTAVQTGNLLFLSGVLATIADAPTAVGIIGRELDLESGRKAAHTAALNALSRARKQLGSLNRVSRVVRLGVSVVATPDFIEHPKVADAASDLLRAVFGEQGLSTRLVVGVTSLPLGSPIALEVILEVS